MDMRIPRVFLLSTTCLAAASLAAAARAADSRLQPLTEEIVITANRTPVPLKSVGSAIDILTAEDLELRPRTEVSDILREVPGVAVSRTGQLGAQTQVRMRGAEANQTLVFINGIEVGDPFSTGEFDFANMLADDVERIEVLRGPQSALYGAQAIGGVINIFTTEGKGPLKFKAEADGGSFGTYHLTTAANGGTEHASYAGSVAYLNTKGISQAARGTEPDGHRNLTLNFGAKTDLTDQFGISAAVRYVDAYGKEDTQDFTPGSPTLGFAVDSNDYHKSKGVYAKGAANLSLLGGAWQNTASVALTDVRKKKYSFGSFSFGSFGRLVDVSYQSDGTIDDTAHGLKHTVTGYIQLRDQTFENQSGFPGPQNQRRSTRDMGYVGEYRLDVADQVFLAGAVRYDDTDLFRGATTLRASAAWQVPQTGVKLRASFGEGFAKPGFFELFGFDPTSFIGNPNLKPETSKGWDAGTDISFAGGRGYFSFSYYAANLRNEIFTNFSKFPFTAGNQPGKSTRRGAEVSVRYLLLPDLNLAAAYSYTASKDSAGKQEVRRPRNIASVSATYRFLADKADIGLSADYNGNMQDVVFTPTIPGGRTTLGSFTLITASAAYRVAKTVELFGRIENLAGEHYQEVFSYNTMGRAAYGGVRIRFGG
ncbi:MAG: TonB-dependent receptor [Rhodospirillaceae bacterium]|nr:TonB-dependent receptor [Rhodospirillaceae bacterium]